MDRAGSVMAVGIQNKSDEASHPLLSRLVVDSLLGMVFLLGSLGIVFYAIPVAWEVSVTPWLEPAIGPPVSITLRILAMLAAGFGLTVAGTRFIGKEPVHGLRPGIVVAAVIVLLAVAIACAIGTWMEARAGDGGNIPGLAVTLAVGLGLLGLGGWWLKSPRAERLLIQIEDQGWFSTTPYKKSQGLRVRRATIMGILLLAGCGIYSMLRHNTLATVAKHWAISVPFTGGRELILLPDVRITLPLVLAGLTLWFAWRVVNFPTFADFLIATEAELNKVSWTTRQRLIQDTIVVMVTVILLTVFLFVVDQGWAFVLTRIGVLQITPAATQQVGPKEQPW
jgi:preprotein translocase SecE subunit